MENELRYCFRAENGLHVCVRPLGPQDAPHLVDIFEHLSPESRYRRFNIPLTNPDPELVWRRAQAMAEVDPDRGRGWLAFADLPDRPDTPVAGIRYIRTDGDVAEVSLAVRDDMQGIGIGTELFRIVGRHAYHDGVRKLVGYVQSSNRPLWGSLRQLGVPLERKLEGTETYVEVDLEEASRQGLLGDSQPSKKS